MDDEERYGERKPQGCACFRPSEAPGYCPGRANCPLCQPNTENEESQL